MLTLIVARDRNGAIGRGKTIPWHAPEDLAMFKRETLGGALVMGRRTWESLPVRPLPSRLNIVVSRDASIAEHVAASPLAAVEMALRAGYRRVYGIGGAAVYAALLPLADRLMVTEVALEVAEADTWFPDFSEDDWHPTGAALLREAEPECVLTEYLRRLRD